MLRAFRRAGIDAEGLSVRRTRLSVVHSKTAWKGLVGCCQKSIAVKEAYAGKDLRFNVEEKAIPNIVDRLVALFERKGRGVFEKWKVARILADGIMAVDRTFAGS